MNVKEAMSMLHIFSIVLLCLTCITTAWKIPSSIRDQTCNTGSAGLLQKAPMVAAIVAALVPSKAIADAPAARFEYQPALTGLDYGKPRTFYPDYTQLPSGLKYKLVKPGDGKTPKKGDKVSVDWEGYTIGYYGRPFQVRNKVKGGAFDSTTTDYFRWVVGSGTCIAALDEAVQYLKEGNQDSTNQETHLLPLYIVGVTSPCTPSECFSTTHFIFVHLIDCGRWSYADDCSTLLTVSINPLNTHTHSHYTLSTLTPPHTPS